MQEVVDLTAHALSDSIIPDLTDDLVKAFDVDKPFTYQLVYDVEPKLTWKQPYKGMKVIQQTFDVCICHNMSCKPKHWNMLSIQVYMQPSCCT